MAVRGHHLRGAIGGLLLGIGLWLMLTMYGVIHLGEMSGTWVVLGALGFGIVWSYVAPAPRRRSGAGPPPAGDAGGAPAV